jgi:hypothetical protein
VKLFPRIALVVALAACSNANELSDGVIAIQVVAPQPPIIDFGDTVRYVAIPLDKNGDSVAAPVEWVTPDDTSIVIINSATGLVTGAKPDVAGRLQAVLSGLTTGFFTLTIQARADTIIFPVPSLQTVTPDQTTSLALLPVIASFNPAGPVVGRKLAFNIIKPTFADTTGAQNVALINGLLADTVFSGADGTPFSTVIVERIVGRTAPDTCIVQVTSLQSNGRPVPGSGQQFLILFQ